MLPSLFKKGPEDENINSFQEALNSLELDRKRHLDRINQAKNEIEEFKSRITKCKLDQETLRSQTEEMKSKIELYSSLTTKLEEMHKKNELNEVYAQKKLLSLQQYGSNLETELKNKLNDKKEFVAQSEVKMRDHLTNYAKSANKTEILDLILNLKATDQKLIEQKKLFENLKKLEAKKALRIDLEKKNEIKKKQEQELLEQSKEKERRRIQLEEEKRKQQIEKEYDFGQLLETPKQNNIEFKVPAIPSAFPTTSSIKVTKLKRTSSIVQRFENLLSPIIKTCNIQNEQTNDEPLSETVSELQDNNAYKELSIERQETIQIEENDESLDLSQNSIVKQSMVLKPNKFFSTLNNFLNKSESDYNINLAMTVQMSNNNLNRITETPSNNLTQEAMAQNTNGMLSFVDGLNKFSNSRANEKNFNFNNLDLFPK